MVQTKAIILVVDDEKNNRRLLQAALEAKGYHARLVASGQEALDYVQNWHVDLILLDIMMPEMDGFEVLQHLRRRYTRTSLPVIMVTAMSASADITQALETGANDYVTKPIDIEVMNARIHTQLSLKQARVALEKSIERFDLAVQGTSDGIWDWNLETNEIYYSPRWKGILGYDPHLIKNIPREWFERIHPEDRALLEQSLDNHLRGRDPKLECEYRMMHRDGTYRWVLTRGTALTKKDGTAYRVVGGQTDITHNKLYDPQTGLYSRSLFEERLSGALLRCVETQASHGYMLLIGLDQFGFVRNSLGEMLEDELLIRIGKRLKDCIGSDDCLARFGGDNFALLMPRLSDQEKLYQCVATIRQALVRPFSFNDLEVFLHISMGVVHIDTQAGDSKAVVRNAYAALEEAKRKGKDSEAIFDQRLHQASIDLLRTEAELRHGIEADEFVLHYQPIISLKQGRVVACEALVRWNHPRRGFLSPFHFIEQAESSGLIIELGDQILHKACSQARTWMDAGTPVQVAVNFSAHQFHQKNMVRKVQETLELTGLPPDLLKIELTETALIEDIERTIRKLNELRELGIRISLDDFGTGYSSLSYLKRFPIDILKVDQSFIRHATADPTDAAITHAIIQLGYSLNMDIISEGVETAEHLEFLKKIGCDLFQGYYISRPIDAEAFTRELQGNAFLVAEMAK